MHLLTINTVSEESSKFKERKRVKGSLGDDVYPDYIRIPLGKHVHLNVGVFETSVIIYKHVDSIKRSQRDVEASQSRGQQ